MEILWGKFFKDYKREDRSNVFNGEVSNERFELFYKKHILKLLVEQKATRYVAKNNYNITRLSYLLRIFPDPKFLLIIRNPINHIASTVKQCMIFEKMSKTDKKLKRMTEIIGHHEFGPSKIYINVDNTQEVKKIRRLWDQERNVKGWALYWNSLYGFMADQLKNNERLRKSTLVVKYEDLCRDPGNMISKILDHTELSPKKFQPIKERYINLIQEPKYYDFKFNEEELNIIDEITKDTAKNFGYEKLIN